MTTVHLIFWPSFIELNWLYQSFPAGKLDFDIFELYYLLPKALFSLRTNLVQCA